MSMPGRWMTMREEREERLEQNDPSFLLSDEAPTEEELYDLAELFKVFGDSTRIKILSALSGGELCVCDISKAVGMTNSAVSHQLKILKNAELVSFRREGKTVFYSLADGHVNTILKQGLEHVNE